jgi:hypothetical protein
MRDGMGNPGFEESCVAARKALSSRRPNQGSEMVKTKFAILTAIAPVLVLFSCAPKKAVVVEPPVKKKEAVVEAKLPGPPIPAADDDPLRIPDMFELPGDSAFRATVPIAPRTGDDGNPVIARPPTDPPSRPKPKEGE